MVMGIGPLGLPVLFLIFVIALLVFGPRKLPEIGRALGKAIREFRKVTNEPEKTDIDKNSRDAASKDT